MSITQLMQIGIGGKLSGPTNPVTLPNITQAAIQTTSSLVGSTAYAGWRFNRDGTIDRQQSTTSATWVYSHDWCTTPSSTVGDDFEINIISSSGWQRSDLSGTFADLNTGYINRNEAEGSPVADGPYNGTGRVTIREKANTSNSDFSIYTGEAEVVDDG
jgi:hypothetical protein